jgi:hypothetical protein
MKPWFSAAVERVEIAHAMAREAVAASRNARNAIILKRAIRRRLTEKEAQGRDARPRRRDRSATSSMPSADELVYVNQDGSVRELSRDEREYLSQAFHPGDGRRPYIKASYESQDGWGSVSGFLPRKRLPRHVVVEPVNPHYVPPQFDPRRQMVEDGKRVGDIVTENADGSVTCAPNPNIPHEKRFALLREIQLERQREREKLARHPDHVKR